MTKARAAKLTLTSGCTLFVVYLMELVNLVNQYDSITNDVTNTISAFYG